MLVRGQTSRPAARSWSLNSTVQFAVTHLTVSTFRASFADVEGRLAAEGDAIVFEARALADSVSIVEPSEFREHVVHGADFFDAETHPAITFRSTDVQLDDDGTASVAGELMIREVSRGVTAAGTYRPPTEDPFGNHRAGIELAATIDRRSWGLDWQAELPGGGEAVGWDVEISVQLELIETPQCACSRSAAASAAARTTARCSLLPRPPRRPASSS
jgi:polyisoprenoid-binding protein YceI